MTAETAAVNYRRNTALEFPIYECPQHHWHQKQIYVVIDYICLASPSFDHTRYMLCSLLYDHHLALFPVSSAYLDSQNYTLGILCPISTSAPPISWQSQNITFVGRRMWQVVTAKKNRISSIYHFVGWRKAEIGWIRPRRPSLKFCGKRFGGGVQTQRCANSEGVPRYW